MLTTRVFFNTVPGGSVDTSYIEPFGYYETAVKFWDETDWTVIGQTTNRERAQRIHEDAVTNLKDALEYSS